MRPEDIEYFCAQAVENHGLIITREQALSLLVVPDSRKEQLAERLLKEVRVFREELATLLHAMESRLSGLLRPGTLARKQSDLSLLLSAHLGDLRLSDVKTEVLASWLVGADTSDLSNSCFADGESAGELPTPSRSDDALPLKHAASVTVFPSEEKGERP